MQKAGKASQRICSSLGPEVPVISACDFHQLLSHVSRKAEATIRLHVHRDMMVGCRVPSQAEGDSVRTLAGSDGGALQRHSSLLDEAIE